MNKKRIDISLYGNICPRWAILLVDTFIIALSFLFAYNVHIDSGTIKGYFILLNKLSLVLGINVICLSLLKIPSRVLRYSSLVDIVRIFLAQTIVFILLFIINTISFGITKIYLFSLGVLPMLYVVGLVLLISLRIIVKLCFEYRSFNKRDAVRVMIYAGDGKGADIAKRLRGDIKLRYRIQGFISDNSKMYGRYLMTIPIYINDNGLLATIDEREIDAIVVDSDKMRFIKDSDLTDCLLARGIKLITLSSVEELENKKEKNISSTKEIEIEDLLMRDPIGIDMDSISFLLRGKCIMITGAAGSIGCELVRQVADYHPGLLILIDQAETPLHNIRLMMEDEFGEVRVYTVIADITNKSRMEDVFRRYKPQYVFHVAAYKHVPMLEINISEAIQVNIMGTCNIADLSLKYKVDKFILISTDKVMRPSNIMGASKRVAEIYVQLLAAKLKLDVNNSTAFITARFGNVLDSSGSVLCRFKEQIVKRVPLTVTHPDVIRYFTTKREVVNLILELILIGQKGMVYTFDKGIPVKILDLAKRMINLSGYELGKDIKIEFVGLRHGEKLLEEPLDKKCYKPTKHEMIMIAPVREYDYNNVDSIIGNIIASSYGDNDSHMINNMKTLVPDLIINECCCTKFITNN